MLIPKHYEQHDLPEILHLIDHFPLASIVTNRQGIMEATYLPLILENRSPETLSLIGHVDRRNSMATEATPNETVLVLFRGVDGYISPNWYPGKLKDENQVPTWNFQVVNLTCRMEIMDSEKFLRGALAKLVTKQESNQPKRWKMTDSHKTYIDENLKKILGVRFHVTEIKAMYKLSQNRNEEDFQGALQGLREFGRSDLAEVMEKEHERPQD